MSGRGELSWKAVENLKRPGLHWVSPSLYLQVTESGGRSWILRYMFDGRARAKGLGDCSSTSLADARARVATEKVEIKKGVDPIERDRLKRIAEAAPEPPPPPAARTFRTCAEDYIVEKSPNWKNAKHAAQWLSTLRTYAYPVIGDKPIEAVSPDDVKMVLSPIWNTKNETASRVRGRIEAIIDREKALGKCKGDNPARWREVLKHVLADKPKPKHFAAMAYQDVPSFYARLSGQPGAAARALRLAILTALRTQEVLGARWEEVDLDAMIWTIPAERMKAKRPHQVPLAAQVIDLLREASALRVEGNPYVLPGMREKRPLSNMSMLQLLKRMECGGLVTPHGFRSSFKDWATEETEFEDGLSEMALAHVIREKTRAAYKRGDLLKRRRPLMAAWADYCAAAIGGAAEASQ